jgi:hypothetical protein
MNEQEQKLLEIFRAMGKDQQQIYLMSGHIALVAQEVAIREYEASLKEKKRQYGLTEPPKTA